MFPRRLALPLAALAAGMAVMFVPLQFEVNAPFWERFMDAAHLPFFAALTVFLDLANPTGIVGRRSRSAAAALLALLAAGAVEVIQPLTGRSESLGDFLHGLSGIVCALLLRSGWRRPGCARQLLRLAIVGAIVALTFTPAWRELRGIWWRAAHFPLLGDFETGDELRLWIGSSWSDRSQDATPLDRTAEHASRGAMSLRIGAKPGAYPGVRLLAGDADWRGRGALTFDVFNPGEPFTLGLRIDDRTSAPLHDDRFNAALPVAPGWNRFRIPLERIARGSSARPLDLSGVRRVLFFLDNPGAPHVFHLDHVRLER